MYKVTDKSTAHGYLTPHGYKTPHRYPVKTSTAADLLRLDTDLYPTGRAFILPEESNFSNLHEAINISFLRLINTAYAVVDSTFPDNPNFDSDDADLWEYRFGITTNPLLTIEQRRANLLRKLSFRSNQKARQHYLYIQSQLQAAGFMVNVFENVFYDGGGNKFYKSPAEILGVQPGSVQHGGTTQHGAGTQHGGGNTQVIANEMFSEDYNIGGPENLWATFFIAGNTLDQIATIEKSRETEFRRLVLSLKPAHLVAFIFVNYV